MFTSTSGEFSRYKACTLPYAVFTECVSVTTDDLSVNTTGGSPALSGTRKTVTGRNGVRAT